MLNKYIVSSYHVIVEKKPPPMTHSQKVTALLQGCHFDTPEQL